jgi:group I intron endonuclease
LIENIRLKDYPKKSGVYKFICNNKVVYVGSSKNIYQRMNYHKSSIKKGCNSTGKQFELYQFLQQNNFLIDFEIVNENYKQLEQQLIDQFKPRFNFASAFAIKERQKQKSNEWHRKNYPKHKPVHDKYLNQLCEYNGEIIKLNALSARFFRRKISNPTQEAKKYLIK